MAASKVFLSHLQSNMLNIFEISQIYLIFETASLEGYLGQSIQEWTKQPLWKTAFVCTSRRGNLEACYEFPFAPGTLSYRVL